MCYWHVLLHSIKPVGRCAVALYCIRAVAPSVVIAAMAATVELQHLVKGGNLLPAFPWVVKDVETVEGIPFLESVPLCHGKVEDARGDMVGAPQEAAD